MAYKCLAPLHASTWCYNALANSSNRAHTVGEEKKTEIVSSGIENGLMSIALSQESKWLGFRVRIRDKDWGWARVRGRVRVSVRIRDMMA